MLNSSQQIFSCNQHRRRVEISATIEHTQPNKTRN